MRLISSMSVKASAASRFSMRMWTHVCACACVHIQTLKRSAAEALDDMKKTKHQKALRQHYHAILHPHFSVDTSLLTPILNMARAFRYRTSKNRTLSLCIVSCHNSFTRFDLFCFDYGF